MTLSRTELRQRMNTRTYLYTVVAQYVGASPEINYWLLPDVLEWEYNPESELYTTPAVILFYINPSVYWSQDRKDLFRAHLAQATGFRFGRGSYWEVDFNHLHLGIVVAVHLSQQMTVTSPDGYHSQTLYLPSGDYVPNRRYVGLLRRIWRDLFHEGWRDVK